MPTTAGDSLQTPQRSGRPAPAQSTVIIRTDDPTYMPASSRQVQELTDLVCRLLRDEIQPNVRETVFSPISDRGSTPCAERHPTQARFERLAAAWRSETQFCSTVLEIATNPSYQQIIGMGRVAIPFILTELSRQPDHWFWALKAITGKDPVPESDKGDLQRMTQAWLIWGVRNGYDI